jgi:hypothetical protein
MRGRGPFSARISIGDLGPFRQLDWEAHARFIAPETTQLDAFKSLETAMFNAIRMASVNDSFIEDLVGHSEKEGTCWIFTLTNEQTDNMVFLAEHTLEMVEKLHLAYYAPFEAGTEPSDAKPLGLYRSYQDAKHLSDIAPTDEDGRLDAVCGIVDKIAVIRAHTLAGMKAKAGVAFSMGWNKDEVATAGVSDAVNIVDSILRDLKEID